MVDVVHEPRQLMVGAALMLGTAVLQTFGVVVLEEAVGRVRAGVEKGATRPRMLVTLCGIIIYLFALHLTEMSLWAVLYLRVAGYPSFATALYESALAFTTMDVAALPPAWKFLSAAEGVTGLLMFAWSTGVLFNQTSWVTKARHDYLSRHGAFGTRHRTDPGSD
jgi:hypothetical protein